MKKKYSFIILLILFIIIFFQVAYAEEKAAVKVDGKVVLNLFSTKEKSASKQASDAMKVIQAKQSVASPGKFINLKKEGNGYSIYWGKSFILSISPEQAKKHKSDIEPLANIWKKKLAEAVGYENLKVSSSSLKIPLKEQASLTVGSSGKIELSYNKSLLDISINENSDKLSITPSSKGEFRILVKRGKERALVTVICRERAGTITPSINQIVTGNPATQELIYSAVIMRIWDAVTLKPGAKFFIKELPCISRDLERGANMKVIVPLVLEGEDYFRTEGEVVVNVINENMEWKAPDELWVSNRPESVKVNGTLFRGKLTTGKSVRLLYSHKNISPENRKVIVSIFNKDKGSMKILLRKASAGPDKYEMYTGHKAAMRYMSMYDAASGYLLELAGGTSADIEDSELPPSTLLSGFSDFQILSGKEAEVTVRTYLPTSKQTVSEDINQPFDPFKIHPHGTFNFPSVEISENIRLSSQSPVEIEVGKWPWKIDSVTGEPNTGNYGVIYKLKMKVINDTSERKELTISFMPLNGLSQGSVIIDSMLYDIPAIQKNNLSNIKKITLAPAEEREIHLTTIPEASSCYPVKFIFSGSMQ